MTSVELRFLIDEDGLCGISNDPTIVDTSVNENNSNIQQNMDLTIKKIIKNKSLN